MIAESEAGQRIQPAWFSRDWARPNFVLRQVEDSSSIVRSGHETYPRRLFTKEFKILAIKPVTEQQLNVAAAGQQLDVVLKFIRAWIAESEHGELKVTLGAAKLSLKL